MHHDHMGVGRWSMSYCKNTNLEDMECLKLDILALVSEQIHHHLQIRLIRNVPSHYVEICAV